MKLKAVTIDNH